MTCVAAMVVPLVVPSLSVRADNSRVTTVHLRRLCGNCDDSDHVEALQCPGYDPLGMKGREQLGRVLLSPVA
jgi:hypothetical protein